MEQQIVMKRLIFIKYLFSKATEISKLSEPMNAPSLLLFHDAIEFFLDFCGTKLNVNVKNCDFLGYWEKINPKLLELGKNELTQKESLRKLVNARNTLKHHSNLPSKTDIEQFRVISNLFFEENCKNIFSKDIEDISLFELISDDNLKKYLKKSYELFGNDNYRCIAYLNISLDYLMKKHSDKVKPFLKKHYGSSDISKDLEYEIDFLNDSIEELKIILAIKGIDYSGYLKFKSIIPPISSVFSDKEIMLCKNMSETTTIFKKEDFQFCYDYLIDLTLKLQENIY